MFRHAMVDLETFGLRRGNALRSIAVIPFDPFTGEIADRNWWFYQNVDFASQEAVGLTKDPSTVDWWNQPEQAAAQRLLEPNQETLTASLLINAVFEHCDLRKFGLVDAVFEHVDEFSEQAQKFQGLADVIAATGSPGDGEE